MIEDIKIKKIECNADRIEYANEILKYELREARKDYEAKKLNNGKVIDYHNMRTAINKRAKVVAAHNNVKKEMWGDLQR